MNASLSSQEKFWWLLAAALFAGLSVAVAWKLWPILFPHVTLRVMAEADCDLNYSPCSAEFPNGGRLELSLSPRPLAVLKPLRIEARVSGLEVDKVEVDFSGVDMYMGFNRPGLSPGEAGIFSGQAVLPVCTVEFMLWEAQALLHTRQGLHVASFRFRAGNP